MGNKQKKSYPGIGPSGSTIVCDSKEEMYFTWWLKELYDAGYIETYGKAEEIHLSFSVSKSIMSQNKGKVATRDTEIMGEHKYTPDFFIDWSEKAVDVFLNVNINPGELFMFEPVDDGNDSLVEIKPAFDQQNMTRLAIINIKWVYAKEDKIINMIIPNNIPDKGKRQKKKCLFHHTFTPLKYMQTDKSGAERSIKHPVRSLAEYIMHVERVKENYAIQRSVLDV